MIFDRNINDPHFLDWVLLMLLLSFIFFQFKKQINSIGDSLDEYELVMTTLNGLTRPWESFIQLMCAKKESMKFDVVWEDCIQEETRVSCPHPSTW